MPPKDGGRGAPAAAMGSRGKGRGKGGGGGGGRGKGLDAAKRLAEMDDRSIEAESSIEILRAQRAAARRGVKVVSDIARENEGLDEEDPLITIDAGIRLEPFNMRREMAEGHFDEGGFYILNKTEEKEVTDAWLDTVDQAEKTASFRREEAKKKAGMTAASRLAALSRNLKEGGQDGEEKDEDAEDGKEGAEVDGKGEAAQDRPQEAAEKPAEEEPEEVADEISMLEALIGELRPLETPSEALARYARGDVGAGGREVGASPASGGAAPGGDAPPAAHTADPSAAAATAAAEINSSVTNAAEIAAAAEKAAAKEKADAESAAALAAESSRMTKHALHSGLDAPGPEAAALLNLNADDAKAARAVSDAAVADDAPADGEVKPEAPATSSGSRKRVGDTSAAEMERRRKISKLTDLCDALLQKGVNVYESARELLAIEVRQRRGDALVAGGDGTTEDAAAPAADGSAKAAGKEDASAASTGSAAAAAGKVAAAAPTPELVFDNRRCSQPADQLSVVDADAFAAAGAAAAEQVLLWQFRWAATPEQIHGPFDSVSMQGWITQGCFAEERPAEIRQCDAANEPSESCWHRWDEINFELYI